MELLVIFAGVTSAFFVESYRERLGQQEDLRQAAAGILAELRRYEERTLEHAEAIEMANRRWLAAVEAAGAEPLPDLYRIPGAPYPPTAAWDAAVSSGVASQFEPDFRLRLGYYYTEFLGTHVNYVRRLEFIEREVMPRAREGPSAFRTASGELLPAFAVEMRLYEEFGEDLRALSRAAGELADELAADLASE